MIIKRTNNDVKKPKDAQSRRQWAERNGAEELHVWTYQDSTRTLRKGLYIDLFDNSQKVNYELMAEKSK